MIAGTTKRNMQNGWPVLRKTKGFDWSDYIWITAPQSYISANLSGGTDKANYYVAVSHIDQEATVRGYGGFRRTNAQMNIDMNISDRFKIGATMNGRIEDRHHPGVPEEMIHGYLVLQL